MRAIVQRELGPPEVLRIEEWPAPEPQAGQLPTEVEIANITCIETQLRAGRAPNPAMLRALPTIPGNGVGGVVSAVRAAGVRSRFCAAPASRQPSPPP